MENEPVTANGFTANTFSPDPAAFGRGGVLVTNRPDYHQTFSGFEISAIKRMSNRWMARIAFGYQDLRAANVGSIQICQPRDIDKSFVDLQIYVSVPLAD